MNDFKHGAFAYKAAHIFFTDSKYVLIIHAPQT